MATPLTEVLHAGEFLVNEFDPNFNREKVTIANLENLQAGHVLGRVLTGGAGVATADADNIGDGVMGAVTVTGPAKPGTYRLNIIEPGTNVGTFKVEDPDGVEIGSGAVAAAFSAGGLAFTLADGTADFVAGDGFNIVVTGSFEYKEYNPANTDGSQKAKAVLFDAVDATVGTPDGVAILRGPVVVNASELQWFAGATADQKTAGQAELEAHGIVSR